MKCVEALGMIGLTGNARTACSVGPLFGRRHAPVNARRIGCGGVRAARDTVDVQRRDAGWTVPAVSATNAQVTAALDETFSLWQAPRP